METISIRKTFAHKHILFAGGSGFLGKVWLVKVLDQVPEIGKLYILLRKNGSGSALERFQNLVNSSFVFKPLHDKYGPQLGDYLARRVEIVSGDVTLPDLGLDPGTFRRLRKDLDLLINCVGLVDFNPDVRDALSTNVEGTLHCADFVSKCDSAALLHVSTCYVAGNRHGRMSERLDWKVTPAGRPFDANGEYLSLKSAVRSLLKRTESPEFETDLRARLAERGNGDVAAERSRSKEDRMLQILKRKEIRDLMVEEGLKRARERGWPNTYTYTKALSEALLQAKGKGLRYAIFRPSIVECSMSYPFPGWNEGFNTSGPLAYLLGSWFRNLPARVGNPFDVVPVDLVANGMAIASAELLIKKNAEVYQCGTSDLNLFTIERACELTALGHRVHLRKHGKTPLERIVLSRWDAKAVDLDSHFTAMKLRKVVGGVNRVLARLPKTPIAAFRTWISKASGTTGRLERKLKQIDEMLQLFLPFIHDNDQIFECRSLKAREIVEEEFRFTPEKIRWREYWLKVHMPGLRRWCFPAIEGRDKELLKPEFPVRWVAEISPDVAGTDNPKSSERSLRAVS